METTTEKIIEYMKSKDQVSPGDLSNYLGINRSATHRQINKLLKDVKNEGIKVREGVYDRGI